MRKTLLSISLLFAGASAIAQTQVDLTGGASAVVKAGEDVVVTCTAATVTIESKCKLARNSSNGYYYVLVDGAQLSGFYTGYEAALAVIKDFKAEGICE